MHIEKAIDRIVMSYHVKRPLLMLAQPGVGKSTGTYKAASLLSEQFGGEPFSVIELRAATSNPAELADIKAVIDGKIIDITQDWVPTEEKVAAGVYPPRGLIFLDEIADGSQMVQSALRQLLLDRRLGGARLAKGWHCVAAANRQSDKASAGRISTAVINCVILLKVEPDTDIFVKYAYEHNLSMDVIAFCRWIKSPWDFDPTSKKDNPAFCSPRSMEILSDVLKYEAKPDFETISGIIGDGMGSDFSGFLDIKDQLPDLNQIIKDPMSVKVPKETNVAIATAYALMNRLKDGNQQNIIKFIARNEVEIVNAIFKDMYTTHKDLPMFPEVIEWMSRPENAALLSMGYEK